VTTPKHHEISGLVGPVALIHRPKPHLRGYPHVVVVGEVATRACGGDVLGDRVVGDVLGARDVGDVPGVQLVGEGV